MAFGNRFLTCMPDINDRAQVIISHNLNVKTFVSTLKSKGNTICAFQTRNIPHNGHIKILEYLLEVCDHVVINPVIGINFISEIKSDLEIEVFTLPGAYYCNSCMGITIKDCCADFANSSSKENISGTDLRNSINNQSNYAHLDSGLISHITNQFGEELFES